MAEAHGGDHLGAAVEPGRVGPDVRRRQQADAPAGQAERHAQLPEVVVGVSTRGALTFFKACQALAMASGRDFVIPEDVKQLAAPVLAHRIVMKDRRLLRGEITPEERFVQRIVGEIPVPR